MSDKTWCLILISGSAIHDENSEDRGSKSWALNSVFLEVKLCFFTWYTRPSASPSSYGRNNPQCAVPGNIGIDLKIIRYRVGLIERGGRVSSVCCSQTDGGG